MPVSKATRGRYGKTWIIFELMILVAQSYDEGFV